MAKDGVTRQCWRDDQAFVSHVWKRLNVEITPDSHHFDEAQLYYQYPPNGFAFFHRAVKVKRNRRYYMSAN